MIHTLNLFITRAFDVLLFPFKRINPFWGILFLSILMSFVVLYAYKWFSSPKAIKTAKNKIKANILAIRLYKDVWTVILFSFFKSLYYTLKYFLLNFGPLLVILPILFPVFVQMDSRYGMRVFYPHEEIIVKVKLNPNFDAVNIDLITGKSMRPLMNPVYIKALNEIDWSLEAVNPGSTGITIKIGDRTFTKQLIIGNTNQALSNIKMKSSSWKSFIYPVESLFPNDSQLEEIEIHYPGRDIYFAGITLHWLFFNIIFVLIIVLAFKNRFGIEF